MPPVRVLMVCLGNICRSPMAEYVLRHQVAAAGLDAHIAVASAGTSGWHNGEDMHSGTRRTLLAQGIDPAGFASSQVSHGDLARYQYIVAMDDANLAELARLFGPLPPQVFKITDLIPETGYQQVPDPYYSGDFDETWRLVTAGCAALLARIQADWGPFNP